MTGSRGLLLYELYRALSYSISPLVYLHLRWRRFRGLEHPHRWPERIGHPSLPRPPGPLIWFHAVSLGEGMAALPVVKQRIPRIPNLTISMTTTTMSALVFMQLLPKIITIIVSRHPRHGEQIDEKLEKEGQNVALRSQHEELKPGTNIYVVDTLGELRRMYALTPIAVIGGSFLPGLAGHNISEAAAAGCAVLTGCHIGHFSHMVQEMQRLNPMSVLQVSVKL